MLPSEASRVVSTQIWVKYGQTQMLGLLGITLLPQSAFLIWDKAYTPV